MLELVGLSRLSRIFGSSLGGDLDSDFFDLTFVFGVADAGEAVREPFGVSEFAFSEDDGLGSATSLAFGLILVSTTRSSFSPRPRRP